MKTYDPDKLEISFTDASGDKYYIPSRTILKDGQIVYECRQCRNVFDSREDVCPHCETAPIDVKGAITLKTCDVSKQ